MTKQEWEVRIRRWWASLKNLLAKKWWRWVIIIVLAIVASWALYWWPPSGFGGYLDSKGEWQREKTLWDWMDLLIVPILLAGGAYAFDQATTRRSLKRESDRLNESVWQAYLDQITKMLTDEKINLGSTASENVKIAARAQTRATLRRLDRRHRGYLVNFLYDSKLIQGVDPVVSLREADLRGVDLLGARLKNVNLAEAYLKEADLAFSDLGHSHMGGATLDNANLRGADLEGADLSEANLFGARVTDEQLNQVESLEGATLPNGMKYTGKAGTEPAPAEPAHQDSGDNDAKAEP